MARRGYGPSWSDWLGKQKYLWRFGRCSARWLNLTVELAALAGMEKLELNRKLNFTFEVEWKPSAVSFKDRFDKYLDPTFYQHRVSVGGGIPL